jgi:hypothetical protein
VDGLNLKGLFIDFNVFNENNENVIHSRSNWLDFTFNAEVGKELIFDYILKSPGMAPGKYFLAVNVYYGNDVFVNVKNIDAFTINANNYFGSSIFLDGVNAVAVPAFKIMVN